MATPAYLLAHDGIMPPRNNKWVVYHTNTTASVDNADFLVADVAKFTTGDRVFAVLVDDLTKVPLGTAAVSGASEHIVVSVSATAVDLSNTLLATFTDAD